MLSAEGVKVCLLISTEVTFLRPTPERVAVLSPVWILEVAEGDAGGVGGERDLVAVGVAELLDGEGVAAGLDGLERDV